VQKLYTDFLAAQIKTDKAKTQLVLQNFEKAIGERSFLSEPVFRIRIRRIRQFLALPDPLVRCTVQVILLKGHGNEADFLGFLQKLVPHESLTLPFGPFRFLLRIRGDIRIRKTLPVLLSRGVDDSLHH
jgi:hypothetical protein